MRMRRRSTGWLCAFVALLGILAVQTPIAAIDVPPDAAYVLAPGRLIDVGGHKLNLYCMGTGSPTVVMDAGLGFGAYAWALVQPSIATFTRVCSYDRAGYGFSEPGPYPRTSARIVQELRALLRTAGEAPPYVLVGWSFGGMNAKLFAETDRREMAGLVLVDSSHEDMMSVYPPDWVAGQSQTESLLARCRDAAAAGSLTPASDLYPKCSPFIASPAFPPPLYQLLQPLMSKPTNYATQLSESHELFHASADEVRAARCDLETLPMEVLHAAGTGTPTADDLAFAPGYQRLMMATAALSRIGEYLLVSGAGHAIQLDRPSIVIDAVHHVVEDARSPAPHPLGPRDASLPLCAE
jgi:pimeloyl-ACP methyl ester carboxylesterase